MTHPTTPDRRRFRAPSTRGFTFLEVMLALMLSAIVIGAAIGVYRILYAAERRGEARFEQAADLAVTQMTLRRIMNTLVCAPGQPPTNQTTGAAQPQTNDDADQEGDKDADDTTQPEDQAPILPEAAPSTPMMFDLWWEDTDVGSGTATVPVLELVVSEPPVALTSAADKFDEEMLDVVSDAQSEDALRRANRLAETVRGVIEVVPDYDGWMLQWRPTEPAGKPFPLVSHIASDQDGGPALAWEVLSRDEKNTEDPWKDAWAAKLHAEFPQAVRLYFTTTDNEYTDWLFETHDSPQE